MSKKKKVLIGFILVVVLIGFVFGIITITRFCKLQSIWSKVNDNIEKNNFNMETTVTNKGVTIKTQTYYKDGIGKFVSHDGTYIWFDGKKAYSVDEKNKIVTSITDIERATLPYKESFASLYPGYGYNFFERLTLAGNLNNTIKSDHYNGEKVIFISIINENYTKSYWITKEYKELVKAEMSFANGDVYEYKYDMNFHTTKLKDIELPDFSDYTIQKEEKANSTEKTTTDSQENIENTETNKQKDVGNKIVENTTVTNETISNISK